ncbi:nucleotide exchange factor GrpE [Desulfovibrio ferrophilus]|uniref:Protein GrpE n=1 Tax=Desulfovibrio ferrophilus TaxID=241368 RepID=A0A2Z6AVA8_9BACT|nr:nucleotide exchange factor GrpE [Desulfovibrio ferrophilus]BBD07163.1 protein GrpE [Desulfovibrio ferrophilus]
MTDEKNKAAAKAAEAVEAEAETVSADAPTEIELTEDELQALCRDRICPQCPVGAEAEDVRLRSLAELDNARKRMEKEKNDFRKYATEKVLADLLPVVDNLDLALMHTPEAEACKNFVMGVDMTRKAFLDMLANNGLVPVGEVGEEFTPERHEAMGQDERDDIDEGLVTQVVQRGYLLNGRLLRPAKTMVSKKPE